MKKHLSLLLAAMLLCALSACGAAAPGGGTLPDEALALHLAVETTEYEDSHTMADGAEIFRERYVLPYLALRTADGAEYTPPATANNTAILPEKARIRDAFNAEMDGVLAALREESAEMAQSAAEYSAMLVEQGGEPGQWVTELTTQELYESEGGLLSVQARGYAYYGGAHPISYTRTWNFDLTTGEFLSIDDLAAPEGDLDGRSLTDCVYRALSDQVREQELAKNYFDDYDSYLRDFSSFAVLNFTESGLRVTFDTYIIAPYAAGEQVFTVPYHAFYNALNERGRALLDIPQEEVVLADFDTAETLWAWSFMTTPPTEATPNTVEIDGCAYLSADIPGVSTMEELRALLRRYFDGSLVDEWMNGEAPRRYAEAGGRLYVLWADRGSNISIGDEAFAVALDGDGGEVRQTVFYQDYNEETGAMELTGETEEFVYPFTLVDGHAVFSAFPCPW